MLKNNRFRPSFEALEDRTVPTRVSVSQTEMLAEASVSRDTQHTAIITEEYQTNGAVIGNTTFVADQGDLAAFSASYTLVISGNAGMRTLHSAPQNGKLVFDLQTASVDQGWYTVFSDKILTSAAHTTFRAAYYSMDISASGVPIFYYPDVNIQYNKGYATTYVVTDPVLTVARNTGILNQSITPNSSGVVIGSFTIQNPNPEEYLSLKSFTIGVSTSGMTISNFSALRTSDTSGSGSVPVQLSGSASGTLSVNTFAVNDFLRPGESITVNILADTAAATSGTITTTLSVYAEGAVSRAPVWSNEAKGQTMSLGVGQLGTPTVVISATTPSQSLSAGSTTQMMVNFTSIGGTSTVTDFGFLVKDSSGNPSQTITRVDVNLGGSIVSAFPTTVNGVQYIWIGNLNLLIPSGGAGRNVTFVVYYATVGLNGISAGLTSRLSLEYMRYSTGSTTQVRATSAISMALGITPTEVWANGITGPTYTL